MAYSTDSAFNNIVVVCNEPHDIDPSRCAFCEIERLQAELEKSRRWSETIYSYIQVWQRDTLISGGIAAPPHMQERS